MQYNSRELSYIIPIYIEKKESNLFEQLLQRYETYSADLLERIQFVFIDDHSPLKIEIPADCKLHYTLARVDDDIMWNQGGARNLGVHLARTSKLILTDLDHQFPESLIVDILDAKEPQSLYMFRREKDGQKIYSHPNTFFCTKATYFKSLGVDEEFCGHYGYEDIFFIDIQKALGTKVKKFSRKRVILNEHKNSSQELHSLKRDTTINGELLEKKREALKSRNVFAGHSRLFLNFKWSLLQEK